jgi:hypothetical protein
MIHNLLDRFKKKISNFVKVCAVGTEVYYMDIQTDMMKLIVALCNFANVPNNNKPSLKETNFLK